MGNAEADTVWITLQVHRNVVAVAALKEVAAVLLVHGAEPDGQTLAEAREEGVAVIARFVDGKSPSVYFNCIRARRAVASRQNGMS